MKLLGELGSIFKPISDVIGKTITDKDLRMKLISNLEQLDLTGYWDAIRGQLQVNMAEAQHASIFVAGWRPFIGWICGAGLAWNFILLPLLTWGMFFIDTSYLTADDGTRIQMPPELDLTHLIAILTGMLGLSWMRSSERKSGVARSSLAEK